MGRRLGDVIADCLARATGHGISATVITKPDGGRTCESPYEWSRRAQDEVATWAKAQGRGRTVRILAVVDTIITGLYSRMASLRLFGTSSRFKRPEFICQETVSFDQLKDEFGGQLKTGRVYDVTEIMLP